MTGEFKAPLINYFWIHVSSCSIVISSNFIIGFLWIVENINTKIHNLSKHREQMSGKFPATQRTFISHHISKTQRQSRELGRKIVRASIQKNKSKTVSPRHYRTSKFLNSQQLWLCAWDLHKMRPVNNVTWDGKGFISPCL